MAQVEQLQNAIANQRLSRSRTSLDDNEYATRFGRLDGAIGNLSFNIRKDWKTVPAWLQPVINEDACAKGTKEMTVVGRAFISRWIVDELLDRYFHPGIEPNLSVQLKLIEKNLRRMAPPAHSLDEEEALLSKISAWRLTTIDGLPDLQYPTQESHYRAKFTVMLNEQLTSTLRAHLNEPAPAGLEGGISSILELAVGLAANVHLESRDVFVHYPIPGTMIALEKVTLETGLPPLGKRFVVEGGGLGGDSTDRTSFSGLDASSQASDSRDYSESIINNNNNHNYDLRRGSDDSSSYKEALKKKTTVLGGFMGKKQQMPSSSQQQQQCLLQSLSTSANEAAQRQASSSSVGSSPSSAIPQMNTSTATITAVGAGGGPIGPVQTSQQQQQQQQQQQHSPGSVAGPTTVVMAGGGGDDDPSSTNTTTTTNTTISTSSTSQMIRVAAFMTVEVRNRSVLVKAPVWTF